MMPCKFTALDGSVKVMDLDAAFGVVLGRSGHNIGWSATIVYDLKGGSFVELRSAPPDYRGNSASEAAQVSDEYLIETFYLSVDQLQLIRSAPDKWRLVDISN